MMEVEWKRFLSIERSGLVPAGPCVVCGSPIEAGGGLTAFHQGRMLRFKCAGCVARFVASPRHYLEAGPGDCCGPQGHPSPPSEWVAD